MWRSYYTARAIGFSTRDLGTFVALRATAADGLSPNNTLRYAKPTTATGSCCPRNLVIALEVPWLPKKENADEDDLGRRSN